MELKLAPRQGMSVLLAALLMFGATLARGQDSDADSSASAQDPIALLNQRIAAADSAQDAVAGATARLELAALVKPHHALRVTQEAAALLDSADVAPELALRAHRDLADRYTGMKALDKANREWGQVVRLSGKLRQDAASALEKAQFMNAVASARIDSLTTAMGKERASASNALATMTADHERRTDLALMAIGGGFIALLLSTLFFFFHIRRLRADIKQLQEEATWLRMVGKKGTEPTVVASSFGPGTSARNELPEVLKPNAPQAPTQQPTGSFNPQEDAMLLALVRRRGEERLQTLREARSRGDHDKVMRVVHSLKPQLVSLDAPYFTDLCGRLVTTDPNAHPQQWSADLDRFEAGMARVLAPGA
jgi:hypothetical protein